MSVTFFVQQDSTSYIISCSCGAVSSAMTYLTYEDAENSFNVGFSPVCEDEYCAAFSCNINAVVDFDEEVNVSNVNARHILTTLGVREDDLCGTLSGSDIMGRILMAQAINPVDAGVPVTQEGIMIDCGRPEGYTDSRLSALQNLADYAMKHDLMVSWS